EGPRRRLHAARGLYRAGAAHRRGIRPAGAGREDAQPRRMTPVGTRPSARMVGGLLVAAFLLLGASPCCRAAAPPAGDLPPPPSPDGKPVKVAVSLHIINIASIDEVKEQFEIDGYLMARWIDARLAFTPTRPTELHHQYNRTQIWIPSFAMANAVAPRE